MWVTSPRFGILTIAVPLVTLTFSKVWLSTTTVILLVTSLGTRITISALSPTLISVGIVISILKSLDLDMINVVLTLFSLYLLLPR